MNDYVGKICPYCKTAFTEDDDVVVCSACDMPHHKECWVENQGCTTFGCPGTISSPDGGGQQTADGTNTVFCTNCGHLNESVNAFCSVCGNRLKKMTAPQPAPQPTPQPVSQPQPVVAYGGPAAGQNQSNTGGGYTAPGFGTGEMDMDSITFIGPNAMYYLRKFHTMKSTGAKNNWNWAAFIFAPFWFFYRKMYSYGGIALGATVLLNLLMAVSGGTFLAVFFDLLIIAGHAVVGVFGDYLYMQYYEKHIAQIRNLQDLWKVKYASANGGVNSLAVVISCIGYVVIWSVIQGIIFY